MINHHKIFSLTLSITLGAITSCHAQTYFGQYKQDKYVNETFFKGKTDGIFVDIGAHDGITCSNSYFFEKSLGWKGICIEPLPNIFPILQKNRDCICINACIADFNGTGKFLKLSGCAETLSGLVGHYHPKHMGRINAAIETRGGSKKIIESTCYRLDTLLDKYDITHIDYLSMDTEGNELSILKTIDFEKYYIEIIDVENNYNDPEIEKFLKKHGYKRIKHIVIDEIYRKES